MATYSLNINGKSLPVDVAPDTPLLWVLRDELNLVGTKYGCGVAQCGACTVHLGDVAVRSCSLPVSAVGAKKVTTIEGLSEKGDHPLQLAWDEADDSFKKILSKSKCLGGWRPDAGFPCSWQANRRGSDRRVGVLSECFFE